ncbi:MAG: peptidoglycan editing factor PgeF [Burkholderiaceae bacterium]
MTQAPPSAPAPRDPPDSLAPEWPVPVRVRAFTTLRSGGVSAGAYGLPGGHAGGWNLGAACGDDPANVARNRLLLRAWLPDEPVWLQQVHGTEVWCDDGAAGADPAPVADVPPVADAAVTTRPGRVLVIQTADCLPVFVASESGDAVGVAHAGWRGLAAGVLERTMAALRERATGPRHWHAWLGPAIGPDRFEVGDEVREAFVAHDPQARRAFRPAPGAGKWWADLYELARQRLRASGLATIAGGAYCTVSDPHRFYSYRRDRQTGRMASVIWIDGDQRASANGRHVDSGGLGKSASRQAGR